MPLFAPPADAVPMGAPNSSQRIDITVVLCRQASLAELQPFLSGEESSQRFGAHPPAVEALKTFARQHKLDVVRCNPAERLVTLSGTVSAIEEAFSVKLLIYQWRDSSRLAPDRLPSMPPSIAVSVESVVGLSTLPVGGA